MKRVRQFFSRYRSGLQRAGAVLLALAVWQGLAMGVGQQLLVPSPLSVVERLGGIWQEADFWGTVWFTFRKIVAGFLLGLGFGLGLGALAGRFPLFEILFRPWATMIKSIPVASFIIICLIWMSSSRLSIFISFLMVLPIVYTNVLQSIRSADRQLLEAVSIFRLSGTLPLASPAQALPSLGLHSEPGHLLESGDRSGDHRHSRRVHRPNVLRCQGLFQHSRSLCLDRHRGGDQRAI